MKIVIPGRPVPKGRPRVGARGNVYTPQRTRDYEQFVAFVGHTVVKQPMEGDLAVTLRMYISGRNRGDIDNYTKAVLDGLQGIAFGNDKQITKVNAEIIACDKDFERVEVTIKGVDENENR